MKQVFMQKNAMRAAAVCAEQVPVPVCGETSVLIANRHSLISAGTESTAVKSTKRDMVTKALRDPDIRQSVVEMLVNDGVRRTADRVQYEMTKWTPLGYSGAGIAVDVGSDVDGIQRGDRVAYGGQPHAEFIHVSKNLCVHIPDGVSTREAAFVALGSIALQGVRRAEVQVGDTVAVLGLGLVGQLASQLLQAAGARVIGSDLISARLKAARELGAEAAFEADESLPKEILRCTCGIGVDRVVICASTSSSRLIEQAVMMARDKGRIVVVGQVNLDVPRGPFYMKELDLVISRSYGPGRYDRQYEEHGIDYPIGYVRWTEQRNMAEFLRLMQVGKVDVKPLITHEFPLDDASSGYDLLQERPSDCLAVLLKYDESLADSRQERKLALTTRTSVPATRGRVAVIGCGAFARQFHLPNLQASRRLSLQTLVASTGQSAAEMARRYGAATCATDPQDVWNDPEVDAVMILTRDKSHAALAAAALNAGKHVFCEKPVATSVEECKMLTAAAAGENLVCMTGFNRRFAPMMRQIHDVLSDCHGPKMVHFRVNAGPQPNDSWVYDPAHAAGRIVGEACHFVDLFRWLTDSEPIRVTASALGTSSSAARLEDVSAVIDFANGSVATLQYTAQGSPLLGKERMEIFCDGTAIAMDGFQRLTVRGRQRIDAKTRHPDKGHAAELTHFTDVLFGKVAPEICIQDGIMATLCCLNIVESARRGEAMPIGRSESLS